MKKIQLNKAYYTYTLEKTQQLFSGNYNVLFSGNYNVFDVLFSKKYNTKNTPDSARSSCIFYEIRPLQL